MIFYGFHNLYIGVVFPYGFFEACNPLRVAENIVGAADNAKSYCPKGHKMHKPSRCLAGMGIMASHIGNPAGAFDICIEGDDRNAGVKKSVDTLLDTGVVAGRHGDAVYFFGCQFVNGGKLFFYIKMHLLYDDGAIVGGKLLCFFRYAL